MKYYVFSKNSLDSNDWFKPIVIKKIYSTNNFDLASIRYNVTQKDLKDGEVLFLVVDFGISKDKNHATYINTKNKYFPYFVIQCSDNSYFNYEKLFCIKDIQIVLGTEGINQYYHDAKSAFDKFQYYIKNKIDSTISINYTDSEGKDNMIYLSSVKNILFEDVTYSYITKLGFEPAPKKEIKIGPIKIRKRVER